jgi:hypothetical protein
LFSPGTPVSSTNKNDRHDIIEILLKVALNTINQKPNQNTSKNRRHANMHRIKSPTLSHIVVYLVLMGFELTSVMIGTDGIGSCKFNYHTITAMSTFMCVNEKLTKSLNDFYLT